MKGHKLFNKAVAGVLTLALMLGIAPATIGGGIEAYADTATPSLSAYATKTQLTDGTFEPKADGTATNIGKIKFGGKAWYLLGGSGDNVDVFAAENFGNAEFQDRYEPYSFEPDTTAWNSVDYGSATKPSIVYLNNYGASDLRVTLQTLASGGTFNNVEEGMMNETTVTTSDLMNKAEDNTTNLTYNTTDKLYAASAGDGIFDPNGYTIDVNGKTLNIKNTYKDGDRFWLRSPRTSSAIDALYVIPSTCLDDFSVYIDTCGVRPASNLDFSSVLLASAAPAATSNKAKTNIDSDIMNLRLEATDNTTVTKAELGEVSVNTTEGTITATKRSGSATLVVQGNDGMHDWYYTKSLSDATTTVSTSEIADGVDLAKCKVWLEATGSDNMIYATDSTEDTTTKYTVTSSVTNGTITPSGATQVEEGDDLTVEYQAKDGYKLKSITVDGEDKFITDNPASYTFSDVQAARSISVEFEPAVYTITYDGLEDATVSGNPMSYTVESDTITLNSPTKTGYAFSGWTTEGVSEPTKDLKIEQGSTGNKTFTANWVIYTYTVTFDDGSDTTKVPVDYSHKVTKPDDPAKDGYKFGGWYTDQSCTTAWDFDEDTVTKDLILYAKWTKADADNAGSDSENGGSGGDADNNGSDSSSTDGSGSDNNGSSSNGAAGADNDTSNSDSLSKTGDDTNVLGMLALLVLAGAGAGTVFIRRRHN